MTGGAVWLAVALAAAPVRTSTSTVELPRADAETLLRAARRLPVCEVELAEAEASAGVAPAWAVVAGAASLVAGLIVGTVIAR